jgi:hypothetical protein
MMARNQSAVMHWEEWRFWSISQAGARRTAQGLEREGVTNVQVPGAAEETIGLVLRAAGIQGGSKNLGVCRAILRCKHIVLHRSVDRIKQIWLSLYRIDDVLRQPEQTTFCCFDSTVRLCF